MVVGPVRIQVHDMNAFPVARGAFPAQRMTLAHSLVECRASIQNILIEVRVTLGRRDEADRAVTIFLVVPSHQSGNPGTRCEQGVERLQRVGSFRWQLERNQTFGVICFDQANHHKHKEIPFLRRQVIDSPVMSTLNGWRHFRHETLPL